MEPTPEIINEALELAKLRNLPILVLEMKKIDKNTCLRIEQELDDKLFKEMDVILQTPGGDADAAFGIVKLLRCHSEKVNILVPLFAKSAGTLLCLGADKILLSDLSELGPLDTQIPEAQDGDYRTYKSALNGFKALEQIQQHAIINLDMAAKLIVNKGGLKMYEALQLAIEFSCKTTNPLYSQLNPKTIGEYARALEVGESYGVRILTKYMKWEEALAQETVRKLVYNYPSHSYILDYEELIDLGLPVFKITSDQIGILKKIRLNLLRTDEDGVIKLVEHSLPA